MAWATFPWLRYFSAFSSALLLLKAMDDFRLPAPACPGAVSFSHTCGSVVRLARTKNHGLCAAATIVPKGITVANTPVRVFRAPKWGRVARLPTGGHFGWRRLPSSAPRGLARTKTDGAAMAHGAAAPQDDRECR